MTKADLIECICAYARGRMASKATSKVTQFMLGAISGGIGRSLIETKVSPIADICSDQDGNLKWSEIKASISDGFGISKTVPVLGGLISLDMDDANDFFSFVEANVQNVNNCQTAVPAAAQKSFVAT